MKDALETLGLSAGAGPREVELAYRALIKQYHPDRPGGDAARAAEITSAYRELRQLPSLFEPANAGRQRPVPPPNRRHLVGQGLFAASLLAAGGMLAWGYGERTDFPMVARAAPASSAPAVTSRQPASREPVDREPAQVRVSEDRPARPPGNSAKPAMPSRPNFATAARRLPVVVDQRAQAAHIFPARSSPVRAQAASRTASQPRPGVTEASAPTEPREIPAWQRPLRQPWQQPLQNGERG